MSSDARKRAEEALRVYDHECKARPDCVTCTPRLGMALRSLLAALPAEPAGDREAAPRPALTLTRDEAVAAGLPIHPEAVGVKVYGGARVSQPDAAREAAERLRDDLKYVSPARVEAEHGSDVADAIRSAEALLAALDAARGGAS